MLTDAHRAGLNHVLDEAIWLHLDLLPERRAVACAMKILQLPSTGYEPDDLGMSLVLRGVSRIAASYRAGAWDDRNASTIRLTLDELAGLPTLLGPHAVYGGDFVDPDEVRWRDDLQRASVDVKWSETESPHRLRLFKEEGIKAYLVLLLWFTDAQFQTKDAKPVNFASIVADNQRWWVSLGANEGRTKDHGIYLGGSVSLGRNADNGDAQTR